MKGYKRVHCGRGKRPEKYTHSSGESYHISSFFVVSGNPDAPHITAIAGDKITLNCDVNFPNGVVSPYVVQWWRKVTMERF